MLNKELEENKKKLEDKEKELNNIINMNNPRSSVEASITEDINELKDKNRTLEEENILLRQELENEKLKNKEDSKEQKDENENEGKKGGKYNLIISYVSQLLKEVKPSGDKEKYLCNKIKGIIEKEDKEKEKGENTKKK